MNFFRNLALTCTFTVASASAMAECNFPAQPEIADGETVSKEEMIAGQTAVKDYMAGMETYLACLDAEEKELTAAAAASEQEVDPVQLQQLRSRYNAGVDAMETVAAQFNEEVREFNEAAAAAE